jgi:hypothetical protein
MRLNADRTVATVEVRGTFTAPQLEAEITRLAMLRSRMLPPVPEHRPDVEDDPDKPILMESEPALTAALRRDGGIRLWLRNRGIGWMGYEVEPSRARAIAKYILSRTADDGTVDLFSESDSKRH